MVSVESKNRNLLIVFFSIILSVPIIILFLLASKLRPISDDYCAGSVVTSNGLFGGIFHVYQVWSGDLFSSLITYSLVGMPIRYFNFNLASATPFLLAFVPLSIYFYLKLDLPKTSKNLNLVRLASTFWFYLSCYASVLVFNLDPRVDIFKQVNPELTWGLSLSLTYWQNINSAYIITPGIILLLLHFIFFSNLAVNKVFFYILGPILGVFVGTAGAWIFATYIIFELTFFLYKKIKHLDGENLGLRCLVVITACLTFYFSLNSPGTRNRRGSLTFTSLQDPSFVKFISWVVNGTFEYFFAILLSFTSLTILFFGFINGCLIRFFFGKYKMVSLRKSGYILLLVGITSLMIVRSSEAFAYPAFWHLAGPMNFFLLGIYMVAMSLAPTGIKYGRGKSLSLFIGSTVLMTSIFISAGEQVNLRLMKWNLGASAISGIADIEAQDGYIRQCWDVVKAARNVPERGLL